MRGVVSIKQRIRVLTNLSILIWVSILNAVGKATRDWLLSLLLRIPADSVKRTGLVGNGYQLLQERLTKSLQLIEQKDRQLEESREQLRKSRDLLQNTIDSLDEELMVLDHRRRITQANRKLRAKLKDQDVTGRYCYEVSHGLSHPCRPPCVCPLSKVWETGRPVGVIHTHNVVQNGHSTAKYVEVTVWPIFDATGKVTQVVELARDITESKEQENRVLESNRYLLALNAIGNVVSQTLNLDTILNVALDKVLELMAAEVGYVLLLDENSQTLSCLAHRGLSEYFVREISGLALGEGIGGKVTEQGEAFVMEDISRDPTMIERVVVEEGLKAFVSVPLKSKERVVGALNIAGRSPRLFTRQEIHLLTAIGKTLGIAVENAKLYQEVHVKEETRTELLRRLISAQEDERRRVARELHDVTSQALATVAVRLEALTSTPRATGQSVQDQLQDIRVILATTSKEIHGLIYDLRPTLLDDLGLSAALRSCAQSSLVGAGVEVHFEVAGQEKRLPPEVAISVFRIVQEAITNIARHAKAESAYIGLEFKDKSVAIQVEDDGIGFDLAKLLGTSGAERGIGLLGMKERAELLGGTLNIDTMPGSGTRIAVGIPVRWEGDDDG